MHHVLSFFKVQQTCMSVAKVVQFIFRDSLRHPVLNKIDTTPLHSRSAVFSATKTTVLECHIFKYIFSSGFSYDFKMIARKQII